MADKNYIPLKDLEVYQLSRELSRICWKIYSKLNFQQKKTVGDQFITSADSVGANIAEGYARFHYLDKIRFYYISRGSLSEAVNHWSEIMLERDFISPNEFDEVKIIHQKLEVKLNNFISSTYKSKQK
jgi:four helix bundle protein